MFSFEGDFKTRPKVSLGGASRKVSPAACLSPALSPNLEVRWRVFRLGSRRPSERGRRDSGSLAFPRPRFSWGWARLVCLFCFITPPPPPSKENPKTSSTQPFKAEAFAIPGCLQTSWCFCVCDVQGWGKGFIGKGCMKQRGVEGANKVGQAPVKGRKTACLPVKLQCVCRCFLVRFLGGPL